MTIRVRYKGTATVSSTTAEEKDLGNLSFEVVTDTQNEGGIIKTSLAVSATDIEVTLGNVAAGRFIMIRTNANDPTETPATVQVKKNTNGNEAWDIVPLGTGATEGHFMCSTDSVTSLFFTNTSGSVIMDVTVVLVGD